MNWENIHGFEAWAATLEQLIANLTKAFDDKNVSAVDAAVTDLRDFIKHSDNSVAGPLDDIAIRTLLVAVAKNWELGVVELHERSAELAKLTSHISSVTGENVSAAESIRMTRIRTVIDKATESINAFKELKTTLAGEVANNDDVKAVVTKVESAIRSIQNLRTSVENLD